MQLELPIRWSEKDKEAQENEELIKGDKAEDKIKFTYGKLLIDSEDIGPYYDLDDHNTMINDKLGKVYCVRIPLLHFKKILTEITGKAIMTIQVVEEDRNKSDKPSRRKPPKNDEDDILM